MDNEGVGSRLRQLFSYMDYADRNRLPTPSRLHAESAPTIETLAREDRDMRTAERKRHKLWRLDPLYSGTDLRGGGAPNIKPQKTLVR
jgi:hypothetical protein